MRLLLVNDEILTAKTMKKEIEWANYGIAEVETANSVSEAKKVIQEKKIDLILCDIEMPKENGLQLLEWIRNEEMEIECIFLTCHASFQYAQRAIELGCQNYILIPAKYEVIGTEILKTVNYIKEKRHSLKMQEYGTKLYQEQVDHAIEMNAQRNPKDMVKEVISYIVDNLSSPDLTVNSVAEYMFLHPVYLNRLFKKEKKIAIRQYIIEERMRMAAKLIEAKKMSLYAIAEAIGYNCYSSFNVSFRKFYGCSPTQYSNEIEENK